jgi:hypothetical protein
MLTRIICAPPVPTVVQSRAMPAFSPLKARQQAAWASGDFAVIGTTLQIVGEDLCEALDLRAGQRVLDVAAGNGNAASGGCTSLVRGDGNGLRTWASRQRT